MRVGDYVRTDIGIGKCISDNEIQFRDGKGKATYRDVIKSSPNIIDLIKKKDIVIDYNDNIYQVVKVWKGYVFTDKKNEYGQTITLVDYQIKKVITKEEFSSIGYEVK